METGAKTAIEAIEDLNSEDFDDDDNDDEEN